MPTSSFFARALEIVYAQLRVSTVSPLKIWKAPRRVMFRLRFVYRGAAVILLLLTFMQLARAGGPRYIAGISYFNQGTAGTPLSWAQGVVNYYTDQGPLSAMVPGSQGDTLVADAFSQWTSISTVALSVTHAGQLAEDVNGSNVYRNSDGTITMPADIMPSATGTPVGIVYDADGTVTDALLGQGAGDASECFGNAVYGGVDHFGVAAYFLHALVVINGNCVAQLPDPDVEYRLVRVLGRVLGLGWSQMNLNVQTGDPRPTADDYVGFSIMHAVDSPSCVPISLCYSNGGQVNPYQPKMDDQAALSRLYPGSTFSASTARIHGNVYFANASGQPGQGMQGVNVVARWIDPNTSQPSGAYASACVSGFLFAGNVGTTATGFNDATGLPFNRYGSNDTTLEGFFDLAGLQIPNGGSSAQYQLTVEAVDPLWFADRRPLPALASAAFGLGANRHSERNLGRRQSTGYCHARQCSPKTRLVWADDLRLARAIANSRRLGSLARPLRRPRLFLVHGAGKPYAFRVGDRPG